MMLNPMSFKPFIIDCSNSLLFFDKSYDICSRLMGERGHEAIVMLKNMGTYYPNLNK